MLQICTAFSIDVGCIISSINCVGAEIPIFHSSEQLFICLSLSPHLHRHPPSSSLSIYPYTFQKTKKNQKGEAQRTIRCVLPIFPQIAYLFCFTWRKRKYIKITAIEKLKERRTYTVKTGVLLVENIRIKNYLVRLFNDTVKH
jgi:hypothetical protein